MNTDAEQSTTRKVRPLRRLGLRRLTRAHLALAGRPRAAELGQEALAVVADVLSRELGCPVTARARLLDAAVPPATGLAKPAVFALMELSAVGGTGVLELEPALAFAALERIAGAGQRPGVVTELARLEEATLAYLLLLARGAVCCCQLRCCRRCSRSCRWSVDRALPRKCSRRRWRHGASSDRRRCRPRRWRRS
jgi:type III secretion protein Q